MKAALETQASGKFLVTNRTDFESVGADVYNGQITGKTFATLTANGGSSPTHSGPTVVQAEVYDMPHLKAYGICSQSSNSMKSSNPHSGIYETEISKTLDCNGGNPVCNQGGVVIVDPTYCIQGNTIDRSDTAGANGKGVIEDKSYTLNTVDRHAVCHSIGFCPNNSSTAAGLSEEDEKSPTLSVTKNIAVCYTIGNGQADQTKLHDVAGTLNCMHDQQSVMTAYPINTQVVTRSNKLGEGTGFGIGEEGSPSYTLQEAHSHGVIYAIDRAAFNQGENAKYDFQIEDDGVTSTIVARGPSAVCYNSSLEGIAGTLDASYYKGCGVRGGIEREFVVTPNDMQNLAVWIVRRLTPRECERLQGFEDDWTLYDTKANELKDTPRYKALGNSIAIPCALRVFKGIVEMENKFN